MPLLSAASCFRHDHCLTLAVVILLGCGRLLCCAVCVCCRVCSQLAGVRRECAAALQVAVDVGLGRWVKLLAGRSAANTRLKQYELRQLLELSEQVGGGRVWFRF
eukprot:GHRQ01032139.1.p1 GENE.GHRQ01032139.1~~GHRQ01032139.1.p1  ORF type:complete len:105 (+),score=42.38 GHRQ01032139.1:386-700(+)